MVEDLLKEEDCSIRSFLGLQYPLYLECLTLCLPVEETA